MKFILGKKLQMTQCFQEDGTCVPVTVISAGPLVVTQVKNPDVDGYTSVQVAYEEQKENRATKAHLGHVSARAGKEDGINKAYKHLREFRDIEEIKEGDVITVSAFKEGDIVTVSGISKSKGFQGVVKRHNFAGGPRTHGQKHSEREPGSIGGGLRNRVPKGMRMAGRMGGDRITIKNLEVVGVDNANNQLLIKGAIPGRRGTLVEVIG
ncbi:MAG TPA: 50S ribosomal protein L3 [Candidatus Paceibacterota bacterium]|nr:50S ribosomal protein L3 [Candidatus Paceibacterota bacterium]HPI66529.1 50S ribosomal protein L3 [Candidatus Paceibacterota bacterium]HQC46021.1 50S ribosomal protein L3 [Candidatus Paceibacterota bacterium]HQM18528.1 50S ribosomal protein L3 [Candidatus Paceibacterota bacterium]